MQDFYSINKDTILNHFYTWRNISYKVFLFSEKLQEMINIISDMNINILIAGMVAFEKERSKDFPGKVNHLNNIFNNFSIEYLIMVDLHLSHIYLNKKSN